MESFLQFQPPQLPALLSPEQLASQLESFYPEVREQSDLLRDMGTALASFGHARGEYEARNVYFVEWMKWYRENPTEKEKVLAFVKDHGAQFNAARDALKSLEQAVVRWVEAWGDRNNLSAIRGLLENVEAGSRALAQNLQAIEAANLAPRQPKILPQKRATPTT